MKAFYLGIVAAFCSIGACGSPSDQEKNDLPLRVAKAYGFENIDGVKSIRYTWNVRVDSQTVRSRSWDWDLESGRVGYSDPDTSLTYHPSQKDSVLVEIDRRFINDKYWLLFPFQLAWDTGYRWESFPDQTAPISGYPCTKLTIVYGSEEGYTPGDAYDLYLDGDNIIKEWVFRRGNGATGRAMTWENERIFNGIKIAMDHKDQAGDNVLWISGVAVERK